MEIIHTDKPIENIEEDVLGRKKFIDRLISYIKSYESNEALTVGLYGKWGSGKTSILNIVAKELDKDKDKYKTVHFNPWNFKGQDELLQCFFKDFYNQLDMIDYHKFLTKLGIFFKRIGKVFSLGKYVPFISPYATIIAPLIKEYGETLNNLTYNKSLEEIKNKISNALKKIDKKIVVFIDDIDRLNDKEICEIFQLVKLVGNFENVIYILSMDKDVIISALKNSQNEHSEAYLEKIVQIPIYLPEIMPSKITEIISKNLIINCDTIIKELSPYRILEFAYTGFWEQFKTLRDVNRFCNVFNLKFDGLKDNIDFHDFCIITLFEIKYPLIYNFILNNKILLTGEFLSFNGDEQKKVEIKKSIEDLIDRVKSKYKKKEITFVINSLQFLFPKVREVENNFTSISTYKYQKALISGFIYINENFDNYFQFNENELLYNKNEIENIIENYNKDSFIDFIRNLNIHNQLSGFLYNVSFFMKSNISKKRADKIVDYFLEFSYELQRESQERDFFHPDCDTQIAYIIFEYLIKYRDSISPYKFIEDFYKEGKLNTVKLELLEFLQTDNGRINIDGKRPNLTPLISVEDTIKIEKIIEEDLKLFVTKKENYDNEDYSRYFYALNRIDAGFCKKYSKQILEDKINLSKFIKPFCICGKVNMQKTYRYDKKINEIINARRVYEIFYHEIDSFINLDNEENICKVCFVMSYEGYKNNDISYTLEDIKKYLLEKRI